MCLGEVLMLAQIILTSLFLKKFGKKPAVPSKVLIFDAKIRRTNKKDRFNEPHS